MANNFKFPSFQLDSILIDFLKKPEIKELFDNYDIKSLYSKVPDYSWGDLTHLLYNISIDPLEFLDVVPKYFFGFSPKDQNIDHIIIPNNIKYIGNNALSGLISLKSVTLPTILNYIGEYAFDHCTSLQHIVMPDSINTIGKYAFQGCTSLSSITLPKDIKSIDLDIFYGSGVTDLQYNGIKEEFKSKLVVKFYNLVAINISKINCKDGEIDLRELLHQPELVKPDLIGASNCFRLKSDGYTLTARKYDSKTGVFGSGWTVNQGITHSSEITFTTIDQAKEFIANAGMDPDEVRIGKTRKSYDLYKVKSDVGECYLTEDYINWLFLDTIRNNRKLENRMPSYLYIEP